MANHCNNDIEFYNLTKESVKGIHELFASYPNFNYLNDWANAFFGTDYEDPYDATGSKWFDADLYDFPTEEDFDSYGIIRGDSAWSPMVHLCQLLSDKYLDIKIEIFYEEDDHSFGGKHLFENGVHTILFKSNPLITKAMESSVEEVLFDKLEFNQDVNDITDVIIIVKEIAVIDEIINTIDDSYNTIKINGHIFSPEYLNYLLKVNSFKSSKEVLINDLVNHLEALPINLSNIKNELLSTEINNIGSLCKITLDLVLEEIKKINVDKLDLNEVKKIKKINDLIINLN